MVMETLQSSSKTTRPGHLVNTLCLASDGERYKHADFDCPLHRLLWFALKKRITGCLRSFTVSASGRCNSENRAFSESETWRSLVRLFEPACVPRCLY
jgi:hypothetical protein